MANVNSRLLSIILFVSVALSALIVNSNYVYGSEQSSSPDYEQSVLDNRNRSQTQTTIPKGAPKDYPYSPEGSRVRSIVGFFEGIEKNNYYDPSVREKQSVIISLSEAASKLRFLANGLTLETKCNKFIKLINQPNIRTFAEINLLMNEDKLFEDIQQTEANLIARIQNERSFDALSKIQTIVQSLESEKASNLRSSFEPSVQSDLLSCLNYYIYRHQRATFGLTDYVRQAKEKLELVAEPPDGSEVTLKKFLELIHQIKQIEAAENERKMNYLASEWLDGLSELQKLVIENNFELPKSVRDFITNPERLKRLDSYYMTLSRGNDLKEGCLALETKLDDESLKESEKYKKLLFQLYEIVARDGDGDSILAENRNFVLEPKRWQLIENDVAASLVQSNVTKTEYSTTTPPINADDDSPGEHGDNEETNQSVEAGNKPESETKPEENKDHFSSGEDNFDSDYPNGEKSTEQEAAVVTKTSEDLCKKLENELQDGLREFNLATINISQAQSLANSINRFKIHCLTEGSTNYSRWAIYSLTKKLSSWSSGKLESGDDKALAEADKAAIMELLDSFHGTKGKNNDNVVVVS